MYLIGQSKNAINAIAALELKRNLGVCYRTACLVKHKLMQVMVEREAGKVLSGRMEADDTYLGGERKGKRGRGSENKIPFIAAVQTDAQGHPLPSTDMPCFNGFNTVMGNLKTVLSGTYTPSPSPITPTAISPNSSIASPADSTCCPFCRACCVPQRRP